MSTPDTKDEDVPSKADADQVKYWLREIADARKREKNFRKDGRRFVKIFEGQEVDKTQYNILFSNTDTLAPALYNTTPRPVVQRRFKDEDPLAKEAAKVTNRVLEFSIDNGEQEYSPFDDTMRAATLEALVPGRGLTRFKYDPKITKGPDGQEKLEYEQVCGEEVPWDRFLHGYGKKWPQVPWGGIEHHMNREELIENFGTEIGSKIPVDEAEVEVDDEGARADNTNGEAEGAKLACVYEIWSKTHKKVFFICQAWPQEPLKVLDDPLKLTGFFPWPRPMGFLQKISTLTPVALYKMYEKQAEELNICTTRINRLLKACRVHGAYDNTVEGLSEILKSEDNDMVPISNVAAMVAQGITLDKSIWMFPLDKVIIVLQQLYLARQQIKSVIFEITGIADIMRGSSQASETLGAQEIKNQWGTLRLKRMQKEVMRYVRDSLRIVAEISLTKLSIPTLKAMTGLPYPTAAEKAQAQQIMQAQQQQAQMMAQQAQMSGQQPPQTPPPDPKLLAVLSSPTWEDITGLLKNDLSRCYKIDIETNSTVDAEATEDKQNISELLNAMAQFLNGVAPLVENGTLPFEAAQSMLLAIVRRFRFGDDVEDALKKMQPPKPPDDGKAQAEQAKMALEQKKGEQQLQIAQAAHESDKEMRQIELEIAREKARLERESMMLDFQLKQAEFKMKMTEMERKSQIAAQQAIIKAQQMSQQGALQAQSHEQQTTAVQQKAEIAEVQAERKKEDAAKPPPAPAQK
jgi:hypothetical protein